MIPPDFWWLDNNLNVDVLNVLVAESPPIGPDDSPGLTRFEEPILISSLTNWASSHPQRNLHRSVHVYRGGQVAVSGPLVIDIDADSMRGGTQTDAWPVAVQTVRYLRDNGVGTEEMRLLDSGQKGYNIEVRPTARLNGRELDHEGFRQAILRALREANDIASGPWNLASRAVAIDGWKSFVRLWNTPNVWFDSDNRYHERLKREITLSDAGLE